MSFAGVSFIGGGRSSTRSASATTTVSDSGYHLLVVDGYSHTKDITPTGEFLESRPFRVAGYRWRITYFPNGDISDYADYVSLFLFMDDDSVTETVKVQFGFNFVDNKDQKHVLSSDIRASKVRDFKNQSSSWGYGSFTKRENLEKSTDLKDDSLTIKCDIIVTRDVNISATIASFVVMVPESDMHRHFTGLLKSGEGTDVTFEVSGETINAHRCVLAARSAVFRAELFGHMKEGTTTSAIHIDDMEAKVFRLLLSFIYSDLMPDIIDEEDNANDEEVILQHLLVAADRYDIQRLRLMCEEKLCGYIKVTTVATFLELAEHHHCRGLKEACLDFLDIPANLQEVFAAGGLNYLGSSCPSVLIDLIAKLESLKHDKTIYS
ncbi:hypothetical protein HU200_049253 [Digitaria exilis]|uniref:Speckle-type POZ protein n=1 Tax=Digitaria exilis TaxID=1010633 RepID=A0A835AQW6_9POAL|nr:hypothetical protein HU200_049253 [Digitaria exilis]